MYMQVSGTDAVSLGEYYPTFRKVRSVISRGQAGQVPNVLRHEGHKCFCRKSVILGYKQTWPVKRDKSLIIYSW